jgi:hypothetical protein
MAARLGKGVMKNLRLFLLLAISFVLFIVGTTIPGTGSPLHVSFIVAGTILGFIFYLLTFIKVLKTPSLGSGRRILWIVVIVCVPMIGNVIYLVFNEALTSKQIPKTEV